MTVGVDPLYGYGTGSMAASSLYASNPAMAMSSDASSTIMPFMFADYDNNATALAQQNSLMNGNYMNDFNVSPSQIDIAGTYRQIREMQEDQMNYNMRQAELYRLNSAQANSHYNNLSFAAHNLAIKVIEDEQAQIMPALMEFVRVYKQACDPEGKMDQRTLLASACAEYQKITGTDLLESIKANSKGPFWNSFIRTATCGLFGQRQSSDETLAEITGQTVSESSRKYKKAGSTLGGAVGGAAVGWAVGATTALATGATFGSAICPGIGTAIGAGIGLLAGLILS